MKKLIVGLFTATMLSACATTQEVSSRRAEMKEAASERTPSTCTLNRKGPQECNGRDYYVPATGEVRSKL